MLQNKTRIRLTWYAVVSSTAIAILGVFKGMETLAITALGVISTVSMAYIGSKAYTNAKFMETNVKNKE